MILSIDVGIVNLAMVLLNEKNNKIVEWSVGGVPMESSQGLFKNMVQYLDTLPWILNADIVLIEKQPGKNKKMKSVEHLLHTYFLVKNSKCEVIIYDAKFKIPDIVGSGKTQYTKRKKASIERCLHFLNKDPLNQHWVDFFENHKKKDDLADVVMQVLSFIPSKDLKIETKKKKQSVKPRKPNQNQKETKYSKSNLAWFVQNDGKDVCLKNKRFLKDLKRYYSSIEELIGEIQEN